MLENTALSANFDEVSFSSLLKMANELEKLDMPVSDKRTANAKEIFEKELKRFKGTLETAVIAQQARETGVPEFAVCKNCGKHGFLLTKGIHPVRSKKQARKVLTQLQTNGECSEERAIELLAQINESTLPEERRANPLDFLFGGGGASVTIIGVGPGGIHVAGIGVLLN